MNNGEIKRVVHVVSDMHRGGAETMIMNLYRNIDRSKLQFDFICHYRKDEPNTLDKKADYYDEIRKLGGRIIKIPSLGTSNLIEYILNIKRVLNENGPYEAIHVHTNKQAGFALLGARLAKVKKRIIHSHITKWSYRNQIYSILLKKLMFVNATKYCACGEEAGINAFGSNMYENDKVFLLNNGIEVDSFMELDYELAKKNKKKLGIIGDELVIGHIGRFDTQKNHKFIVELAVRLRNNKRNFIILLVGSGPIQEEIQNEIKKQNLDKYIKFLGVRQDVHLLMKIFDVFILPSLFEGLPLVSIEAQAAGTKCITSDQVTNEIDMGLNLVRQLPITEDALELWEEEIFKLDTQNLDKDIILQSLTQRGYNVKKNVNKLYELYELNIQN